MCFCVLCVGFLYPKQKNKNRYMHSYRLHQKAERSEEKRANHLNQQCLIIFSLSYGRT